MRVVKSRAALAEALEGTPREEIKFVPTMGALHRGHMSLVRAAKSYGGANGGKGEPESAAAAAAVVAGGGKGAPEIGVAAVAGGGKGAPESGGTVVVSIFVNPTQFNDPADLGNYPRTPDRDLAMLASEGVDVVFMPSVEEIYPAPGEGVFVLPDVRTRHRFDFGRLDSVMEGASRPGHFNGVAQVVSRLFELVKPGVAFFGRKDLQQVAIIREMVRQAAAAGESWADVEIVECPIVREEDGLALSSRNTLLTPQHRAAAPDIYRALSLGARQAGKMPPREIKRLVTKEVERSGLLKVIYFEIVDGDTLEEIGREETRDNGREVEETPGDGRTLEEIVRKGGGGHPVGAIAVQAGAVRLIDNILMING